MRPLPMKLIIAPLLAVAVCGAALAQDVESEPRPPRHYPLCSKGKTDECVNPGQAPHKAKAVRKAARKGKTPGAARIAAPKKSS